MASVFGEMGSQTEEPQPQQRYSGKTQNVDTNENREHGLSSSNSENAENVLVLHHFKDEARAAGKGGDRSVTR